MKKRLLSLLTVLVLAALVVFGASLNLPMKEKKAEEESKETEIKYDKESIYLWYSDDALTNYISAAAVAYNEEHGTRIVPVLQPAADYLENINVAMYESMQPDMYVVTHDMLGEAYLAGIAAPISMDRDGFLVSFLEQAVNAVSYEDHLLGYPLNFETTVLLYNKTYLAKMAEAAMEADTEISVEVENLIPATIEDIRSIADSYDAPENVEGFFSWDVTDIFYNYFFIGETIDVGGPGGWDTTKIDIYNERAITAMEAYQELNQFFSIDTDETDYSQIISDFIAGKMVYTIATSDVIACLEQAKADGEFDFDYGVALVPDMSEEIDTRSMSVTNAVVISPYESSEKAAIANDFAYYLTYNCADMLYSKAGKVSPSRTVHYDSDAFDVFALEYEYSTPIPKMLETSTFWVDLERTFLEVWNGADANSELKALAEQILYQVTGEETTLEAISSAPEEEEETEYLDEEALMKEAKESIQDNSEE